LACYDWVAGYSLLVTGWGRWGWRRRRILKSVPHLRPPTSDLRPPTSHLPSPTSHPPPPTPQPRPPPAALRPPTSDLRLPISHPLPPAHQSSVRNGAAGRPSPLYRFAPSGLSAHA